MPPHANHKARVVRNAPMLALLALSACGSGSRGGGAAGASTSLECAPYARAATGIQLYGEAYTWWDQAAGRYQQSSRPVPGGVLVFGRTGRLASGHVSVVRRIVSDREITVTQANWVHRRLTQDEPVVDVSPRNDWTVVRVWWEPSRSLGVTSYPTYGFIGPGHPGRAVSSGQAPVRDGRLAALGVAPAP